MMGRFKIIALACVIFAVLVTLAGCTNRPAKLIISSDTYLYVPAVDSLGYTIGEVTAIPQTQSLSPELDPITAPPETTEPPETATPITTADTDEALVYWTKNGEVWHTRSTCSSLAKSKEILSGTVEQAISSGKDRICKRCGG